MTPKLLDPVILQTDFPDLQLLASGKVRDVYQLDNERLLFVATDRISAFDYVLATGIPHKGRVLTQISLFWFHFLSDIVSPTTASPRTWIAIRNLCRSMPTSCAAGR
jgi:phosphoribosylaminoimidazole-succinocarboxamide synthase